MGGKNSIPCKACALLRSVMHKEGMCSGLLAVLASLSMGSSVFESKPSHLCVSCFEQVQCILATGAQIPRKTEIAIGIFQSICQSRSPSLSLEQFYSHYTKPMPPCTIDSEWHSRYVVSLQRPRYRQNAVENTKSDSFPI